MPKKTGSFRHRESDTVQQVVVVEKVLIKMTLHQVIKLLESILPDIKLLAQSAKAIPSIHSDDDLDRYMQFGTIPPPRPSIEAAPMIATLCGCLNFEDTAKLYSNRKLLEVIAIGEKWLVRLKEVNDAAIILAGASKHSPHATTKRFPVVARTAARRVLGKPTRPPTKKGIYKSGRKG